MITRALGISAIIAALAAPALAAPRAGADHCMSLALVAERVMLDRQTGAVTVRQAISSLSRNPESQYSRLLVGAWKSPKYKNPKAAADLFAQQAYNRCVFS